MNDLAVKSMFVTLVIALSHSVWSLPLYERVTLPFPEQMDEADQHIAREVLQLQVYQDSDDPNQYYYVPPFHVRQYKQGAAGMLLHAHNIKAYAGANKAIADREKYEREYTDKRMEELIRNATNYEQKVAEVEEKLEDVRLSGNLDIIKIYEGRLARYSQNLEESKKELAEANDLLRNGRSLLPPGMGRSYFSRALTELATAGFHLADRHWEDPVRMARDIDDAMDRLSKSYGGYLSINAYGGFTREQVEALVAYKAKYMPHLRISLLPVDSLAFFPLTDIQAHSPLGAKLFGAVRGAGDYLGSAIVLDTSIAGSLGLAQHMAPFILPVGIKATFKQTAKPFEANLSCDFTSGYEIEGRADVRDGLVIFDNDVTINLDARDRSRGGCEIQMIRGDQGSAHFQAVMELEKRYEALHWQRTLLSEKEKQAYYDSVIRDVHNNRRRGNGKKTNLIYSFIAFGWKGLLVEGLSRAADFHWHTNAHDVSNLSDLRFDKHLSLEGHETITRDLPTNLCLIYNREKSTYDRCTPEEEKEARDMMGAMKESSSSAECADTADPFECGKLRDEAGSVQLAGDRSPVKDFGLFQEI